jgi:tetratricopeptide (TPR) repeat protein
MKLLADLKFTAAAILMLLCFSGANAQELGGSLGSSSNVFRPTNPKSAAARKVATKPKAAAVRKKSSVPAAAKMSRPRPKPHSNTVAAVRSQSNKNFNNEALETAIAEANAARDARNFIAAQEAYERAAALNPRDPRPLYGLGNVYTDQQRWDEAEEQYRAALKIEPNQADANVALSYVLLQPNRAGSIAERFEQAEKAARRAIAIDPKNAMAYDQLGVSLELRGLIDAETENAYRRAIALNPDFALPYAHLARLLRKKGKNAESAANYKRAVELSNDVAMIILVAEVLQSENRFAESEKLLRKGLKLDENNPVILFLLGRAASVVGNFADAEKFLTKSIRISPRTFGSYFALGAVYLRQGKYDEAERIYNQSLPFATEIERRQVSGAFGLTGVGDGYLRNNRKTDALRAYQKALEIDTANTQLNEKIAALENNR